MAKKRTDIPKGMPMYSDLINPTIAALHNLGGSGTIGEIYNEVIKSLNLSEKIIDFPHSNKSSQSEIQYRLAWARTYLKIYGVITNTSRGVWVTAPQYKDTQHLDETEVVGKVRELSGQDNHSQTIDDSPELGNDDDIPEEIRPWKTRLHNILINMNPYAFERLAQRFLRECGFVEVEVTKKSGDGGIDGYGKMIINGIVSFKVAFQCKRYKGMVSASDIRDFRGSLTADTEKAVFITTGTFSKPAKEEADTSNKTHKIELIDGDNFMDRLAELQIGLKPVVEYDIDELYFSQI